MKTQNRQTFILTLLFAAISLAPLSTARADDAKDDPLKVGSALLEKHQYDEAIAVLTKAIEADGHNAAALSRRGLAYVNKGQSGEGHRRTWTRRSPSIRSSRSP